MLFRSVSASQAALLVGTAEAMGRPVPADARAQLAQLLDSGLTGRRPPKAVLVRIDEASLKGRRGELVLALATAVGPRGPGILPQTSSLEWCERCERRALPIWRWLSLSKRS